MVKCINAVKEAGNAVYIQYAWPLKQKNVFIFLIKRSDYGFR